MKNLVNCLTAQTLLEYYRVKFPLYNYDIHKVTNAVTIINKYQNLTQTEIPLQLF